MQQPVLNRSRSDKFAFVLDLPKALKDQVNSVLDITNADPIQFTTFGSPVPAISVPDINLAYAGQSYHTSSNSRPAYPPLNIKFLVDNGYQNYWILWKWLNLFNDASDSITNINAATVSNDNIRLSNPLSDYSSTFSLFALDEYNNKIIEFKYTSAFITGLSPIEFSFQNPDQIVCNATFVFNQLKVYLITDINVSAC
jgi:hypothetical protein